MAKAEIFENERAAGYDEFVETWIPLYHCFLDCLPNLLRKTTPKDLLVVGCGTGNEIERFVREPEQWRITGVDPSAEMLRQAREKLRNCDNVTLIEGLLGVLDTEKKFGAATLLLVLHFLEDNGDKLRLLQDVADRLNAGAPLVALDITGDKNQIRRNLKVLERLLPGGLDNEQVGARLRRLENELFPVPEQRLSELCVEAGFETPLRFFQSSIYMGWLTRKR